MGYNKYKINYSEVGKKDGLQYTTHLLSMVGHILTFDFFPSKP
jgi:hypothetical protein